MALSDRDEACIEAFRDEASHRLKWLFHDLFDGDAPFRWEVIDAIEKGAYRATLEVAQKLNGMENKND